MLDGSKKVLISVDNKTAAAVNVTVEFTIKKITAVKVETDANITAK